MQRQKYDIIIKGHKDDTCINDCTIHDIDKDLAVPLTVRVIKQLFEAYLEGDIDLNINEETLLMGIGKMIFISDGNYITISMKKRV